MEVLLLGFDVLHPHEVGFLEAGDVAFKGKDEIVSLFESAKEVFRFGV